MHRELFLHNTVIYSDSYFALIHSGMKVEDNKHIYCKFVSTNAMKSRAASLDVGYHVGHVSGSTLTKIEICNT